MPVAVNDAYSTNEDTALIISTSPFLTESFDLPLNDTRGFTFIPGIFNANGNGSSGSEIDIQGNPPGGLQAIQPFRNGAATTRTSGWQNSFTLPTAQSVRVSIDYRATTNASCTAAALLQVQARIGTTAAVTTFESVTGPNGNTGWKTGTFTAALAAGTYTLQFGVSAGNNAAANASSTTYFDNVRVEPLNNTGVLSNDTGGAVTAILNTSPTHGTLSFAGNGTFTYTPAANYAGADSFTYRASDGATLSNIGTVNLTVTAVNDAPVAVNDSFTTTENVTLNVPVGQSVLLNDTDVEAQALTAAIVAQALHGTVTLNANGSFTYVPIAGYSGSDFFTYRASDGTANSNTATVAITLNPVNDPPTAVNDTYTAQKNQALVVTSVGGAGPTTLIPLGATWKYLDNGTNQGTAWRAQGFSETGWKTGAAQLGYGDGDEVTVVEDDATPGSPTPGSTTRYITTYFRHTFNVTDLATLHDLVLSVRRDDGAVVYLNGTVISDANIQNGLTSNPAFDTGATNAADDGATLFTVNLVNGQNLLVEGQNTIAVEVHQENGSSSDISFDLSLTATRGGTETMIAAGAVWKYLDNGTNQGTAWKETVFPETGWKSGPAELGYGDIPDGRPEATVVEDDATPGSPTAGSTTRYITTYFRHTFNVTNKATLNALVLSVLRDDGAVVYLNGTVISNVAIQNGLSNAPAYTDPALNAPTIEESTFLTYNLTNGEALLNEGTNVVAVEIHQSGPTSSDISFNLSLTATRSAQAGVLANDIEPDGQTLTASLITAPIHGTLTLNANGTFTYTPAANYVGPDSFVYRASDGTLTSDATANISVVVGANSPPVAVGDSYTATEDTVLTVAVGTGVLQNDSDSDSDPLTAVLFAQAAHGTVALAANGSFTYTPVANYFGPDSFTYRANDGSVNSIAATVSLTVNNVPDAPVAAADSYATDRGVALVVAAATGVLQNDTDADGQALTAQFVSGLTSGTLTLNPDGSFTYTPGAAFSGVATFTYRASDGALTSAAATVSILVNSRPIAVADTYSATEDTVLNVPAATGVLQNDSDPDNEPITAVLVNNAAHGVVVLNANGSFAYTPAANYNGADAFTYHAFDGSRSSPDVTVTINIAPVNDVPVAVADRYEIPIGETTIVTAAQGVLANDIDPDGQTLTALIIAAPASGALIWNADGSFTYTPAPGFSGSVTFTYRATDGTTQSADATVTLNVQNQRAIVISEIMFNAASGQFAHEWIEVRNTGATPVNVRGWQIASGVSFTFPDTTIAGGGALVVAANVPAFSALFPAVTNVVGPWTGGLSNSGEQIQIDNALGKKIDEVHYSDQGDWADRRLEVLGGMNGWAWVSGADGTGQSLQLRNPALPHDNGQNWAIAAATPGAANSAVASTDLAPLIFKVKHTPQLPTPAQQVRVTARFVDELLAPPTARVTYRTWTRPAAADTASTPTAWVNSTMFDDGAHSDGAAGDGEFGATIPAFPANTIVEFYTHVSDGVNMRTWPAPTDTIGTQGANCLYMVDPEINTGTRPFYRLVMTGLDEINFRFENWPSASDAALNVTFIAQQGADADVRYRASTRIRGASSRDRSPRNWRIDIAHDDDWHNRTSLNLNTQYIYNQVLGSRLMELAGLAREDATVVQVRLNGVNHATDNQNNRRFGHYIDLKPLGSDFVSEQYPADPDGNAYHKVRPDTKWAPHGAAGTPTVASYLADGWSKQTNATINDWTDLHALLRAFTDVAAGTGYYPAISQLADVDEFARWFALCTILNHRETNISNGTDDDYSMYRGVLDPRFKLIGHDFDTCFSIGDTTTSATAGIYQVIDNFGGTTMPVFTKFFQDNTIARKYKAQLRELLTTVFAKPNFDATVDNLLPTDWIPAPHGLSTSDVPENLQTAIKTFLDTRRTTILALLPQTFTATSSLALQNGFLTTTAATTTQLSGTMDAARTAKVTVNGVTVSQSNYASPGTWSAGTAVTLKPGLNAVVCKAWDEANVEIASATVQIVYDDGSTAIEGGTLTADETWSAAGGPYNVTSNLTVPAGMTLTIQPGTSVFLSAGVNITVAAGGRLIAEGTTDLPVTFAKAPAGVGSWGGVIINGAQESRIAYAIFDNNGAVAIHAQNGARVVLDHLTFRNTAQPYLALDGSSFVVSNTTFPNATAAFAPVSGSGIAAGGEAVVRDCIFGVPVGANSALTFIGGERPGPILQVLRNVFNGSPANLVHLHGADAWIEENVFLHCHLNSAAPSASAISGDANAGDPGDATIIHNSFYDCDHAVTMREGNAFALLSNTIVRITNSGGTDSASGVLNMANGAETAGAGGYIFGNIVWDATALTRRYDNAQTYLEFMDNLLPLAWSGPGGGNNPVADPMLNLALIPTPATATAAQVRAAFVPQPCSLAIGSGPFGLDKGALVPAGIALGGIPLSPTPTTSANLLPGYVGFLSSNSYGYTDYRFFLDGGALGAETPAATPISLSALAPGAHTISVIGKNDAGVWQTVPTTATWIVDPAAVTVRINEVLANNVNAFAVGATRPDVIELHNYGTAPVSLVNFSVSDDPTAPAKFIFPAGTTIPAGGYLLLLGNSPDANPGIHLGFGLDADGDTIAFYPPNAVVGTVPRDSVTFGAQIPDLTIARAPVSRAWTLSAPTLGAANTALCELASATALKINEWLSSNFIVSANDFLELYNPGAKPVALGGLHLTDDLGNYPLRHSIAPLSFIGAGGFVKYVADNDTTQGANHLNFSISSVHETLALTDATGRVIDEVPVVPQIEDQSQGRATDGSALFAYFALPTSGFSNNTFSPAQTATFQGLMNNLRVTEMMYLPASTSQAEFVELKNIGTTMTLDLSGVTFANGITHTFPNGTTLAPGAYLVITENLAKFQAQFPSVSATQWVSGKLDNTGENVRIEVPTYGLGVLDFTYAASWYPSTAGGGASLQIIDATQPRDTWNDKEAWQASGVPSPGGPSVFAVNVGIDVALAPGASAVLHGAVNYGSFPANSVTFAWAKVSGPGAVVFTAPNALDSDASFSVPGIYVLSFTATESGGSTSVSDTVQVTTLDSYESWAARTIVNPALRGESADPDFDGVKNLLEFASGLNPAAFSAAPVQYAIEGAFLTLTYRKDLAVGGISYSIEQSSALATWLPGNPTEELISTVGTVQTIKAKVTRTAGPQFLRLKITKP